MGPACRAVGLCTGLTVPIVPGYGLAARPKAVKILRVGYPVSIAFVGGVLLRGTVRGECVSHVHLHLHLHVHVHVTRHTLFSAFSSFLPPTFTIYATLVRSLFVRRGVGNSFLRLIRAVNSKTEST